MSGKTWFMAHKRDTLVVMNDTGLGNAKIWASQR